MTRMENPKLTELYAASEKLRKEIKKLSVKRELLKESKSPQLTECIDAIQKVVEELEQVTAELEKWMEDI